MKVEVNGKPAQKSEYPCLKISKVTGNIVLFKDMEWGTIIALGKHNSDWAIGEHTEFDKDNFTPFTGSITLSND